MDRVDSGTVCDKCVVKFNDFLEYAGVIYEEMCEQVQNDDIMICTHYQHCTQSIDLVTNQYCTWSKMHIRTTSIVYGRWWYARAGVRGVPPIRLTTDSRR